MSRKKIERDTPSHSPIIDAKTGEHIEVTAIPRICAREKHFRELRGLEQKQLAQILGITKNSVSNWENGHSRPDISLIPKLCETLGITLYDLFEMPEPISLTPADKQHLAAYNSLTPEHRLVAAKLIDSLQELEEQDRLWDITKVTYFERRLAAGIGDPSEFDDSGESLYLYSAPDIKSTDYVFTVNGDSMEPDFHSGDNVLVRRVPYGNGLSYGEIGAFIVGNETYIKVYERDGLHSLNHRYSPMLFDDDVDSVYLIGRVVRTLAEDEFATPDDVRRYEKVNGPL